MTNYPYVPGPGILIRVISHFRKSFPAQVSSNVLKKLGLAPTNEGYVINVLKFLKLLDEEGNKTSKATEIFTKHKDEDFSKALSAVVSTSYNELFELRGKDAWLTERDDLITFFRTSSKSSDIVGQRQALTFTALAALSGHGEIPKPNNSGKNGIKAIKTKTDKPKNSRATYQKEPSNSLNENIGNFTETKSNFGLTVRIEINLPASGDQTTYDKIFKSIKSNLIDG